MKKLTKLFTAAALACAVFAGGTLPASANSAQTHWSGVDASGAVLSGGSGPIEVERELLTFDINEFPEHYYGSAEKFAGYNARVAAEYTFYNPSDYEVTATLVFPFGMRPDYARGDYASETEKYGVYIDGEQITAPVRHTLYADGTDTSKIIDGYVENSFYYPDMPVYRETYVLSGTDEEFRSVTVSLIWYSHGRLIANDFNMYAGEELNRRSYEGDEITLWWLGELPESTLWGVFEDTGCTVRASGSVQLADSEQMTFEEFALTAYDPDSGVSQTDYYNAMVSSLYRASGGGAMYGVRPEKELSLMRWYQYEMTLGAGERLINTVTAPMYPDINESLTPPVYSYTYLLSPAKSWSSFGSLDITVNTPYYIISGSLEGFEKTEGGYALSLDGLPDSELEFRMSESERPVAPFADFFQRVSTGFWITAALVTAVIAGGVVLLIVLLSKKKI